MKYGAVAIYLHLALNLALDGQGGQQHNCGQAGTVRRTRNRAGSKVGLDEVGKLKIYCFQ